MSRRYSTRDLLYAGFVVGGGYLVAEFSYAFLEGRGFPFPSFYWWFSLVTFLTILGGLSGLLGRLGRAVGRPVETLSLLGAWGVVLVKLHLAGSLWYWHPFLWLSLPFGVAWFLRPRPGNRSDRAEVYWFLVLLLAVAASTSVFRKLWVFTVGISPGEVRLGFSKALTAFRPWISMPSLQNILRGILVGGSGTVLLLAGERIFGRLGPRLMYRRRSPVVGIGLLLLLTWAGWSLTGEAPPDGTRTREPAFTGTVPAVRRTVPRDELPNILLISMDTLRWDHVLGQNDLETPNLRSLKEDSWVFPRVLSNSSWTLPAHASLFTGHLPVEHGAVNARYASIRTDLPLYPQYLERLGYRNAAFTDGWTVSKYLGFSRGYERYWEQKFRAAHRYRDFVPGPLEIAAPLLRWTPYRLDVHYGRHALLTGRDRRYFRHNVRRARRWLSDRIDSSDPFYAFLHSFEVHDYVHLYPEPYRRLRRDHPGLARTLARRLPLPVPARVSSDTLTKTYAHLYRYHVEAVDEALGNLLGFLKRNDAYDRTLIVFLSDHGEGFSLRPRVMGHGRGQTHEVLLRVPMLIKPPTDRPRSRRLPATLSLRAVFPLIARVAGFRFPREPGTSDARLERILAGGTGDSVVKGSVHHSDRANHGPVFFVRGRTVKLRYDLSTGSRQYFRVRNVPPDQDPLRAEAVPVPQRRTLEAGLQDLLRTMYRRGNPYRVSDEKLPRSLRRELKGVGYLQ